MNQVAEKIARRIRASGALSFAEFMEMALYCPVCGYYEKEEDKIGPRGDFYTSVSSGPLFGWLLAARFAKWLKIITHSDSKPDTSVCLVEAGAHHGALAAGILQRLRSAEPELFDRLRYIIVEPSPRRQQFQRERLREFSNAFWAPDLAAVPPLCGRGLERRIVGVIFSNELLDAMPVHRLGWGSPARTWFEWGVNFEGDRFVWVRLDGPPPPEALPAGVPPELLSVLPDGFTIETCPAAVAWWRAAAQTLARGMLLTCDYGLDFPDFFEPGRSSGTLRSYQWHHVSADVLTNPGEQDITTHVNFDALRATGEGEGLITLGYCTQAEFLTDIARELWSSVGQGGSWTPEERRQFQALTHPEHLGRSFRFLLQAREFVVE